MQVDAQHRLRRGEWISAVLLATSFAACAGVGAGSAAGANASPIADNGGPTASTTPTAPIPTQAQDIAAAKALFANLRGNAGALEGGTAVGTAIPDRVRNFGTVAQAQAVALAGAVAESIRLDRMAFALWDDYVNSRVTDNFRNNAAEALSCGVYQGAVPASLGPLDVRLGTTGVGATSAANATWVRCSTNFGPPLPNGDRRYMQTKVYDMARAAASRSYPTSVPYLAATQALFTDPNTRLHTILNITRTFDGSVGWLSPGNAQTSGSGYTLRGDLPPLTGTLGTLLADHYSADVSGNAVPHASGGLLLTLARGSLAASPVGGATSGGLSIELAGGAEEAASVVLPNDRSVAAQRLAAKATLHGSVATADSVMSGSLVADAFALDGANALLPKHMKFTGNFFVLPAGARVLVNLLNGTLELVKSSTPVTTFDGKLTLPNRPEAALKAALTESSATSQHLQASYAQDGLTVDFKGDRTPAVTTLGFSSSGGVKTTLASNADTADVTVAGRHAAIIRRSTATIVYDDGTSEPLQ